MRPRLLEIVKTVLAAFLGVRRRAAHDTESVRIKPVHVIIVGVIAAALFVATLVGVARLVAG